MKTSILILLFFHLPSFIYSQNTNEVSYDLNEIDSIIVAYVDFDIFTTYNVLCQDFYNTFNDAKYVLIENKIQIKQILESLNSLKEISNDDYIDTRAKLYVYKKNKMMPICIGKNTILYKNTFYKSVHTFKETLDRIIDKNKILRKPIINPDTDKPNFQGGGDSLYKTIGIYLANLKNKCSIKDTLHLLIEFNIDKQGNGVDVVIRNKNNKNNIDTLLMKSCIGKEIEKIIIYKLKWSSSKWREAKTKTYIPVLLYPNNQIH